MSTISPYSERSTFNGMEQTLLLRTSMPASWIVLWEIPFLLVLAYGALVPANLVPRVEWFGVPMKLSDTVVFFGAIFYGLAILWRLLCYRKLKGSGDVLVATLLLFGYGLFRLWNGPLEQEDRIGMAYALLLAASGPIQAVGLLTLYDPEQTRAFLSRLVFLLAIICLIYTAESVLGLGLRSEVNTTASSDFGIQRVRGPLFGPSTGYFLLLPAIGWSFFLLFNAASIKTFAAFSTISLLSAYFGLGSRAGMILLVVYLVSMVLYVKRLKRSEAIGLLIGLASIGLGALIYLQADTQRLTQFEDQHRRLTHETSLEVVSSEPLLSVVAGQGYGTIWSWYRRDTLRGESVAVGDNVISTGFGTSLYHAHSTVLELCVEFGILGLLWLAFLIRRLVILPFLSKVSIGWRIFALSLAVSLLSLGFDLFLFKEVRVNSIWWMFVAAALQMQPRTEMAEA